MPLARQFRPLVRVALPVAIAAALVTLVVINMAVVKTWSATAAPAPTPQFGLYYSLALVGILSLVVGASVRLRRPNDSATLHFFWLAVAFAGVLAFVPVGRFDRADYVFDWADAIARFALAPLFLHFAFVFPDRPNPWARNRAGRFVMWLLYIPAFALGLRRLALLLDDARGARLELQRLETVANVYLVACALAGLIVMLRALTSHRSVTGRRQLRWIVWGSSVGSLPFVLLYVVPLIFGEPPSPLVSAAGALLGCIPLAFASAIVRYRLMDVEVIIKKGLVIAAAGLALVGIYLGTLEVVRLVFGADQERSSSWALFATLVVAVTAPWLWNAVQAGLDRLYYKERYDYRKALLHFARELNSDLDLSRMSQRLVTRVGETLGLDRVAVFLPDPEDPGGQFVAVASEGFGGTPIPAISRTSSLGTRLLAGHTAVMDDPGPYRRPAPDDLTELRGAGLYHFVPCVAKDATMAVVAVGRRAYGEPPSSEDLALLGAVAGQAATALENARLYLQLSVKADEIERLRQFSDSVVESLSDALVVVDLDDRVLRWNRRAELLAGLGREAAIGRPLSAIFRKPFVDSLAAARRESPGGTSLYRVPLTSERSGPSRSLLINVAVAPFRTEGAQAGWILVIEDITDRANLEEQLQLSEKMAAIGLLAAGVAHEVNTPLTGISSFTQMLIEKTDPADPRARLLEKIESQTFRAAKIVSSLLNLARPSGGDTGAVDLNLVIGDILALLEHQFKMSHIQVKRELAVGPVVVRGVEYKLQQVFLNLFLNARDAMPKGGWVSVSTSASGPHAIIEVRDTGVGIPAEHLARIYDPFFTTKVDGRGTGLGLSVTYGIVQEHGGTLSCQSDAGKGTSFRLVLPLLSRPAKASGE